MLPLYIFVDESGNFDFSQRGTNYFVLTLVSTSDPWKLAQCLMRLRYELLPNYGCGEKVEERGYFHASEDQQFIRDKVFAALIKEQDSVRIDSVIAQKNKANPFFHKQEPEFYKTIGQAALKYAFARPGGQIIIVFSSIFDRKKRGVIKQTFKALLKSYSVVSIACICRFKSDTSGHSSITPGAPISPYG
jgi:hypothetical protein